MPAKKYQVLSPDGITIEFENFYYRSMKKAKEAFIKWKGRYIPQGYYSSSRYGRINLVDLEGYCKFLTI